MYIIDNRISKFILCIRNPGMMQIIVAIIKFTQLQRFNFEMHGDIVDFVCSLIQQHIVTINK